MTEKKDVNGNRYLFLFDFDNTLAKSFEPSPNDVSVQSATEAAIGSTMGDIGRALYDGIGGFSNRSPGELIRDLDYAENKKEEEELTDTFVEEKMRAFKPELEKGWPEPFEGVIEFLQQISEINKAGNTKIDIGILSAGHTEFIQKAFENWGVKKPNILITDDDLRKLDHPEQAERKMKPSVFLFTHAHKKWLYECGLQDEDCNRELVRSSRGRILYFGDDPIRDGELARIANVPFVHFDRTGERKKGGKSDVFHFTDWNLFSKKLLNPDTLKRMENGENMKEIMRANLPHSEPETPIKGEMKMR